MFIFCAPFFQSHQRCLYFASLVQNFFFFKLFICLHRVLWHAREFPEAFILTAFEFCLLKIPYFSVWWERERENSVWRSLKSNYLYWLELGFVSTVYLGLPIFLSFPVLVSLLPLVLLSPFLNLLKVFLQAY